MGLLSVFKLFQIDNKLKYHLQCGGTVADEKGQELVIQIVSRGSKEFPEIIETARRNGVELSELCYMYGSMVAHLIPKPNVQKGNTNILFATFTFVDPRLIQILINSVGPIVKDMDDEKRRTMLFDLAGLFAIETVRDLKAAGEINH